MKYDPYLFEILDGECGYEGDCPYRLREGGCIAEDDHTLTWRDYQDRENTRL